MAALDAGAVAALFVEEFGEFFEHDAAQLLGVDDRHGEAVRAGHVVADTDRDQFDLFEPLGVADDLAQFVGGSRRRNPPRPRAALRQRTAGFYPRRKPLSYRRSPTLAAKFLDIAKKLGAVSVVTVID